MKKKINEIGNGVIDLQIKALRKLKSAINQSFSDGSIGTNDTESSTAHKQTRSRRTSEFTSDQAIKTFIIDIWGYNGFNV